MALPTGTELSRILSGSAQSAAGTGISGLFGGTTGLGDPRLLDQISRQQVYQQEYEAQERYRQMRDSLMYGLGSYTTPSVAPKPKDPKNIREELQMETDEWLDNVL